MKTLATWLGSMLLIVVVLATLAGLALVKYRQMRLAMQGGPPPEMPVAVRIVEAAEVEFQRDATMIGTILAPRSVTLRNEVAGTVVATRLQPGQKVSAGEVLVELDSSVERAQLESALARRQIAQSTLNRIRGAAAARAVTPAELDEAEAQFAQSEAQVSELQAVIEKKTLRAPFDARVGLSDTHEGQFLPSGTEITSLQGIDNYLHIDFMIPQVAAHTVSVGQAVELRHGESSLEAKVIALDSQADRQSRNLLGRARLQDPPPGLRPGDSLKVVVAYGPRRSTPAVPPEALQSAPMQTYVFTVNPDPKGQPRARERNVVAGPTVEGRLTILSGLEVGERVVAEGAFKLRDGTLVAGTPPPDAGNPSEIPPAGGGDAERPLRAADSELPVSKSTR